MVVPPLPGNWKVEGPEDIRYGWDELYITKRGQKFSPWYFAKNCAAVLGHSRARGSSELMRDMAEALVEVLTPHLESMGPYRYVRNDFAYAYLWHEMKPPFYGAFMNNVTACGLLHLYEATAVDRYLLLADRLLMTSVEVNAPIPLCSDAGVNDFWLHEYVFRTDLENAKWATIPRQRGWCMARIYNGHIHALLPLMRLRAMTGSSDYEVAIARAVQTMSVWLLNQPTGGYFSYCVDMPVFPDYGQKRAVHLAESLAQLTEDPSISKAAEIGAGIWEKIASTEKEVIANAVDAAKKFRAERMR